MSECVIVAGCEAKVSVPPRLTASLITFIRLRTENASASPPLTSDTYRRHLGPEGDPLTLNPSLPHRVVDRALEKDGARAAAEYMAQFRTDVEGFVSLEAVEACVGDYREQLPVPCNDPATGATHSAHECYQAIGRGAILVC